MATIHGVTRVGHDLVTKPSIILGGFPGGSDSKESACNAEDLGSIPELGRSLGEGNDNWRRKSSILAWKIPWKKEPGRLQSMVLQKSRTQLSD